MSKNKKKFQIKRRGTVDIQSQSLARKLNKNPDLDDLEGKTTKKNFNNELSPIKENVISMEKHKKL